MFHRMLPTSTQPYPPLFLRCSYLWHLLMHGCSHVHSYWCISVFSRVIHCHSLLIACICISMFTCVFVFTILHTIRAYSSYSIECIEYWLCVLAHAHSLAFHCNHFYWCVLMFSNCYLVLFTWIHCLFHVLRTFTTVCTFTSLYSFRFSLWQIISNGIRSRWTWPGTGL